MSNSNRSPCHLRALARRVQRDSRLHLLQCCIGHALGALPPPPEHPLVVKVPLVPFGQMGEVLGLVAIVGIDTVLSPYMRIASVELPA